MHGEGPYDGGYTLYSCSCDIIGNLSQQKKGKKQREQLLFGVRKHIQAHRAYGMYGALQNDTIIIVIIMICYLESGSTNHDLVCDKNPTFDQIDNELSV